MIGVTEMIEGEIMGQRSRGRCGLSINNENDIAKWVTVSRW